MHFEAETLDDLLMRVYRALLQKGHTVQSSRGDNLELRGIVLRLKDPRSRLSRTDRKGTVFSCLGETLWYLAGGNATSHISYYISQYKDEDEHGKIYGGYGPRLFKADGHINQIRNIISLLREKISTRQAVIQLFAAKDLVEKHKDIPCTCTIQFLAREGKLHTITHMRSNDAYKGLPHDVFAFTMLQEIIARTLNLELGEYIHSVSSLHLYDDDKEKACSYIGEAWQDRVPMPPMPAGDPWKSIRLMLSLEKKIRTDKIVKASQSKLHDYWKDLVRLLLIYRASKKQQTGNMRRLQRGMHSKVYDQYILKRIKSTEQQPPQRKGQLLLI